MNVDPAHRAYLLHGADDMAKEVAVREIVISLVDPVGADFDLEYLDASSSPVDQILAAAYLAPFGSLKRVVVLRRAELYKKREKTGDAGRLATGIAALPAASCLVLVAAHVEDRSKSKTVIHAKVDDAVRKVGVLVAFEKLGDAELARTLVERARAEGIRLDRDVATAIVRACRGDRRTMEAELEKARCYIGDGDAITQAHIRETLCAEAEDEFFALVDSIGNRQGAKAFALLEQAEVLADKPHAVAGRLLSLLNRQLRLILQARELDALGIQAASIRNLPANLAASLPSEASITSMAWKARDYFAAARKWSSRELVDALRACAECDAANKGGIEGRENVRTNLRMLIATFCR